MYKPHTIRDQVAFSTSAEKIRKPAFEVINRIQGRTPGEQVVGTAVALVAICEAVGLEVHEIIHGAERIISDVDGPYSPEIRAIKEYAKNEIARGVKL